MPSQTAFSMENPQEIVSLPIPQSAAGRRLDQTLAEMFPDYSRSRLTAWIRAGDVLLDGETALPRQIVRGGEIVALNARRGQEVPMRPEEIEIDVRYEDADLLVINKPAGLVVHPGAGQPGGTLQNALLHYDAKLTEIPRAGIVHRLDKDTSGVMVVARSLRAHTALVAALQARDVHRQYEAVILGALIAGGSVDAPIGRHSRDRLKQAVVDEPAGKPALTHYRLRERYRAHSLVEVPPSRRPGAPQLKIRRAPLAHMLKASADRRFDLRPRSQIAEGCDKRTHRRAARIQASGPACGKTRIRSSGRRRAWSACVSVERPADLEALVGALRKDSRER